MKTAITKADSASAGGSTHHHALRIAPARNAALSMIPQLWTCGSPKPRNDRPASSITAVCTPIATYRKLRGSAFGATCRKRILKSDAPAARAAHTNGRSLSDSTCARITRAVVRHRKNTTSTMISGRLGLEIEITTIANGRNGMPNATSVSRISTSSVQPPK